MGGSPKLFARLISSLVVLACLPAIAEEKKTYPVELTVDFDGAPEVKGSIVVMLESAERPMLQKSNEVNGVRTMPSLPMASSLGSASAVTKGVLNFEEGPQTVTVFVRGPQAPECKATSAGFKAESTCVPAKGDQHCGSYQIDPAKTPKVRIVCGKKG